MSDPSPRTRPTVAFLTTGITAGIGHAIWSGVSEAAQQLDLNLLTFVGGALRDRAGFAAQSNALYRLAETRRVDGFIVWGSSIGGLVDHDEIMAFHTRLMPRPIVSIALPLPGIPTLTIDSYRGMRDLMLHLVQTHRYRRLGFIRGPETHYYAQERFRAYADVLAEFGIPYEPPRVSPPASWDAATGAEAVHVLVDERELEFDALVGANDTLALGAMGELQARHMSVPRDVAVVGFNDGQASRISTPPLTSVGLPFRQQGHQAVELLNALFQGAALPEQTTLPAHLVVRQSCGCPDPDVLQAACNGAETPDAPHDRAGVVAEMANVLGAEQAQSAERVAEAFSLELADPSHGSFLHELELAQSLSTHDEPSSWQTAISILRRRTLPCLEGNNRCPAEDLLQQARIVIGKSVQRYETQSLLHINDQATLLRDVGGALTTALDTPGLLSVLADHLPRLGIPGAYLALYDPPQMESARMVLAFGTAGNLLPDPAGLPFYSVDLVPDEMPPIDHRASLVVEPLYFQDRQLGFVMLESGPREGEVYETLRVQISSALQGVQLLAQNVQLYHQALAANALKSRFLSMVSHELLTPIVLLVGLSEMMLKGKRTLPESYRQDLMRIYTSAQHLGTLVRDVLDLARSHVGELKLARQPLDLHDTFQAVALVGEEMARGKGLEWHADIASSLPQVLGDAARLQQVALNLITNAVKFTGQGSVRLQVRGDDKELTVRVSDTGVGVPLPEQQVIFDEFRQSERTSERGYGGLGIGLAICRRLVEMHGGTIGVESSGEENSGSTFYFSLPVLGNATASSLPQESVLIIARAASDSGRFKDHLARQGFTVNVINLEETRDWESHVSAQAGAIVLDADLGSDIMAALKRNPATEGIPILLCSLSTERDRGAVLAVDSLHKPIATESMMQALRRYGLVESGGKEKLVLVVDDDPGILEMHARLVTSALPRGRVVCADDGARALEAMQQALPSLVLLDLRMPGLDGFGVLEAMQANDHLRNIPVIVLTAQDLTEEDMARLSQGAAAILEKGVFSEEETLAHIEQALVQNRRLGSESQRLTRKVMAFVHQHYAEPLTRERLAACAGVSVRHLNRCFDEELGISPMNYLLRHRISQAKRLLLEGERTITEVATSVGFSSSSYFAEAFRKETGNSPSEFKTRHVGET